jgi:hypothetical protein
VARPSSRGWWVLTAVVLFVIAAWPPDNEKSLAAKFVNWVVDPAASLPVLPSQLGFGEGDDPVLVEAHDAEVRRYDALYAQGGWTRMRLQLKVARDPMNASTERQLLLALAAVTALAVWRFS